MVGRVGRTASVRVQTIVKALAESGLASPERVIHRFLDAARSQVQQELGSAAGFVHVGFDDGLEPELRMELPVDGKGDHSLGILGLDVARRFNPEAQSGDVLSIPLAPDGKLSSRLAALVPHLPLSPVQPQLWAAVAKAFNTVALEWFPPPPLSPHGIGYHLRSPKSAFLDVAVERRGIRCEVDAVFLEQVRETPTHCHRRAGWILRFECAGRAPTSSTVEWDDPPTEVLDVPVDPVRMVLVEARLGAALVDYLEGSVDGRTLFELCLDAAASPPAETSLARWITDELSRFVRTLAWARRDPIGESRIYGTSVEVDEGVATRGDVWLWLKVEPSVGVRIERRVFLGRVSPASFEEHSAPRGGLSSFATVVDVMRTWFEAQVVDRLDGMDALDLGFLETVPEPFALIETLEQWARDGL